MSPPRLLQRSSVRVQILELGGRGQVPSRLQADEGRQQRELVTAGAGTGRWARGRWRWREAESGSAGDETAAVGAGASASTGSLSCRV